jgi:hypothetical protein
MTGIAQSLNQRGELTYRDYIRVSKGKPTRSRSCRLLQLAVRDRRRSTVGPRVIEVPIVIGGPLAGRAGTVPHGVGPDRSPGL